MTLRVARRAGRRQAVTALALPPDSSPKAPARSHEIVLRLTIPGEPLPKQRARVLRTGRTYTPARTREAENVIRWYTVVARQKAGVRGLERGPLSLTARFYRSTARTADLDNLVKLVTDALNGVLWHDDRQVVQLHAARFDRQKNPRTEIEVYRIIDLDVE